MWNGAVAVENGTAVPQRIKHRISTGSSQSTSGYPSKGNKRPYVCYTHVQSSIMNSQMVEATQVSINTNE